MTRWHAGNRRRPNQPTNQEENAMKYMLLIYTDEKVWTESDREKCYAESTELTRELDAKGQ